MRAVDNDPVAGVVRVGEVHVEVVEGRVVVQEGLDGLGTDADALSDGARALQLDVAQQRQVAAVEVPQREQRAALGQRQEVEVRLVI
jgi:hypothetical protein